MSFFRRLISSNTIHKGEAEKNRQRAALINQFNTITLLLSVCGALNLIFLHDTVPVAFVSTMVIALIIGRLLGNRGNYNLSASITLVVVNLQIFYFTAYFGTPSGIYFFYFPSAMCTFFLFNWKEFRVFLYTHLLFLCVLSGLLFTDISSYFRSRPLTAISLHQILTFDLVICVSLLIYFIYLVTKTSELRQKELLQYIEERGESEASMRASIKEKETLLAEVHHRVKNNLAVISGLLNLQMHSAKNDYTRNVLLDCKSRVSSMALVHEKLYKSESLAEINMQNYLPDLIREIRHSFEDYDEQIKVDLSVQEVLLTVSEAIPCGLILNELVTNSFKHAFPDKKDARITISVREADGLLYITVSDNGIGMPSELDPEKAESLGLILIQSLADQLSGQYEFKNTQGTHFSLTFTPKGALA
jgi:two-component sensor histidine kinase